MALYEVLRNDEAAPGEFVSAHVIAGGVAQARKAVGHLSGVTGKNVTARLVDTTKVIAVLSVYFDERDAEPPFLLADDEAVDYMNPGVYQPPMDVSDRLTG